MELPLTGVEITTDGRLPRLTVIALVPVPIELVQLTVTVLAPSANETLLVEVLPDAAPLTVQVTPAGIEVLPLTV